MEKILKTSVEEGLTDEEAEKRAKIYGYNEIVEKKESPFLKLGKKFWGITPWMLEIVIVFSVLIGNYSLRHIFLYFNDITHL